MLRFASAGFCSRIALSAEELRSFCTPPSLTSWFYSVNAATTVKFYLVGSGFSISRCPCECRQLLFSRSSLTRMVDCTFPERFAKLTGCCQAGLIPVLPKRNCARSDKADAASVCNDLTRHNAETQLLLEPPLPSHSSSSSSLCLLHTSPPFFSQLNCKYQVSYFVIFIIIILSSL